MAPRMHLGGVTASPAGERAVQQARNLAFTLDERSGDIRFLIRDRGSDFTASFDAVVQAAGARIVRSAVQAPRMNATCERLAGTLRRELLDRVLILGERHLHAVLAGYQVHCNTARPHQGIAQQVPGHERGDYIFNYWSALGWTILTLGIYGFYVFYQLIRRMRDHNARRLELLDAATTAAWEQAGRRGLQQELTPSFQRAAGHLAVLRQMTADFREPSIWLLLAIAARSIAEIIAFVLLDQDLTKHGQAECGAEYELSVIYGRLGQQVPFPDPGQVKQPDNYVGRILAAIFTLGIYMFWWYYNQMEEPNKHFTSSWTQEDYLVNAVSAVS